ncbi:hypothetical protein H5410_052973 [Solanum commersonii]|uniref:Uncharacterized protein n=1 Tax=Solanum commersonii TaxID=4109 RepID=A0A9J5X318_SOLCO|nr:hypothetical protein H5410_052973 [Solanum commersonii]
MKFFDKNDVRITGSPKKVVNYSTQKSAKLVVYQLRGSFDLVNGLFWPSWRTGFIAKARLTLKMGFLSLRPTGSVAKVLTNVHEIF